MLLPEKIFGKISSSDVVTPMMTGGLGEVGAAALELRAPSPRGDSQCFGPGAQAKSLPWAPSPHLMVAHTRQEVSLPSWVFLFYFYFLILVTGARGVFFLLFLSLLVQSYWRFILKPG